MINAIYAIIVTAMLYAILHITASGLDREHCQAHGLGYGGTTLMLNGYCVQGTIQIPADTIGANK